jgi:Domain of unknown function (DUF4296)
MRRGPSLQLMRKYFFPGHMLVVGCVLLLSGCADGAKKGERPEDVLPPEKMVALLVQAHWKEALLQTRRLPSREAKALFDWQWDSTARALGTDTAAFSRSMSWYTDHVGELDAIYEQVTDSLGVEESRANGKITRPVADSVAGPDSA